MLNGERFQESKHAGMLSAICAISEARLQNNPRLMNPYKSVA
jgi:hypothetical protein